MNNTEQNIKHFKENGYCIVKNVLSQDVLDIITQYTLFDEMQNSNIGDVQVPGAHAVYADPAMESLLLRLKDHVEQNTGLSLYPTYSYYRIYRPGDELLNHRDRHSCEISATLCFNYDYNDRNYVWPIYMGDSKVEQVSGDMVIYRGCDLYHRREKFDLNESDAWHVQGFFHYVDANGPNAEYKFDKRESVGMRRRKEDQQPQIVETKSYIRYTK